MNKDCGVPLSQLQVDGGMTNNKILMQLQADILCIPVGKSAGIPLRSTRKTKEVWMLNNLNFLWFVCLPLLLLWLLKNL